MGTTAPDGSQPRHEALRHRTRRQASGVICGSRVMEERGVGGGRRPSCTVRRPTWSRSGLSAAGASGVEACHA